MTKRTLSHYGDFDSFLKQKALASMGYYRERQSGHWGPKSREAYAQAQAWWNREIATAAPSTKADVILASKHRVAERLVSISAREVGTRERGGNNRGAAIVKYQEATWLSPGPWPWCAAFICWAIREALQGLDLPTDFKRPRTAGAWDFERWAREDGGSRVQLLKPARDLHPGDILCFTFSHIGIATANPSNGTIRTIEGNTNAGGSREGDGVYNRTRPLRKIRSAIRFHF